VGVQHKKRRKKEEKKREKERTGPQVFVGGGSQHQIRWLPKEERQKRMEIKKTQKERKKGVPGSFADPISVHRSPGKDNHGQEGRTKAENNSEYKRRILIPKLPIFK